MWVVNTGKSVNLSPDDYDDDNDDSNSSEILALPFQPKLTRFTPAGLAYQGSVRNVSRVRERG